MVKRRGPALLQTFSIGAYTFTTTGMTVRGEPDWDDHEAVGVFITRAHRAAGFWLADWLRYGSTRREWGSRIEVAVEATGLSAKRLRNMRAVAAIDPSRRRDDVEFSAHEVVAGLSPADQTAWLEQTATEGWGVADLVREIKASKRRRVIEGQAVREGLARVVLCAYPFDAIPIERGCRLPVTSYCQADAVLLLWVSPSLVLAKPGPRELLDAWGFRPQTNLVWDRVDREFGSDHTLERHQHLVIATRGGCLPDRPSKRIDSVFTERPRDDEGGTPIALRRSIEAMYDGPYLELFGARAVEGWMVLGHDVSQWGRDAVTT